MKDYLLVVDANYPSGAHALMADIKTISAKPVKFVFDTHHHGDHAYGNPLWTQAGATTFAYRGVAEEMRRYEPARWRADAARRKDVAELNLDTAEPPRQTFDQSPYVIDDGSRRVEFYFFGWAHTRGDGFVYLPKEQVLCTGDAVTNGPYNALMDANVGNWPNVIAAAQKLKVAHVLPGHGEPGGPEVMEGEKLFMTELHKAVKAANAQGKKLEDLVEMKENRPVKTSLQLPESVKHWVGNGLPTQVQITYEEISKGKPYGEITGGK